MELSKKDAVSVLVERGVEVALEDKRTVEEIAACLLLTGSAAARTAETEPIPDIRQDLEV